MDDSRPYVIEVEVSPRFMDEHSAPEDGRYAFAYTIRIHNRGHVPARLISRHWRITDANGRHLSQLRHWYAQAGTPRLTVRATHDAFVVVEVQLWNAAQLHFTGQLHTQETCSRVEHLDALRNFFAVVLTHYGDEDLGVTHVTADFNSSNGDQTHTRIFDFTTDQLCQLSLHLIADTLGTAVFFCPVLLPVTHPWETHAF